MEWLVIILATAIPRLPTLCEPIAMDQALFAVIGDGLLRGDRLYVDLWDHKPPAIYVLYAAIVRLSGHSAWGIDLTGLLAGVATALLLRSLVAIRFGRGAGLLAGVLYGLAANPVLLGGFYATAQAEVFMESLLLAALVLAAKSPRGVGVLSGLALGSAALFKPTALLFAPLLFAVAPGAARTDAGPRAGPRPRWARCAVGASLPALAALAWLAGTRSLAAATDALVSWNVAALGKAAGGAGGVAAGASTVPGALSLLFDGIVLLGPFLAFPLAGAALSPGRLFPLSWLGIAILSVFAQGKFYRYHYEPLLAPLVALAALGVAAVAAWLRAWRPRAGPAIAALLVLLSLVPFAASARAYWRAHRYRFPFPSGPAREEFLRTYVWAGTGMRYEDAARLAGEIRARSAPDDRIYVLGFDPQVYWLAGRAPAGRYLAHDHLRAPGAEERLVEDLERRRPRWVAVVTDQVAPSDYPRVSAWIAENTAPRETIGRFALFEATR